MCTLFRPPILTIFAVCVLFVGLGPMPRVRAQGSAQAPATHARAANPARPDQHTLPALLISDIHFDPFHDPGRVQELVAAPVTGWPAILAAPPSPNQQQAFAALQQSCHARGVDSPYTLLRSSLDAMSSREHDAKFITVSGDLIAHSFDCRYSTLLPQSTPADYQAFVLKTLSFVLGELRAAFPGTPVYVALGNNDTGCGDYQLDTGGDFLAQAGTMIAEGLPAPGRQLAIDQFATGGYYSVNLPEPMQGTRLIVVNDLFLSPNHKTCSGKLNPAAASDEMSWLQQQLSQARAAGQRVWVMGHIPPGIDPYSTVARLKDVCGADAPVAFLSSDKMAGLMVEYADVIRLGIFAHTHMDEMRLLAYEGSGPAPAGEQNVAIKIVPSISPVDGNLPSFTVARVNPASAVLVDYDVVQASNQTGIDAHWTTEYNYERTYHQPDFSPSAVKKLIAGFSADIGAAKPASQAYIRNYFVGDVSQELSPFWPQYVCALGHATGKAYASCICSALDK